MSDERSSGSPAADETDAADADSDDTLEPGGGPQRVVSEESVDDILESLDSTRSADGSTDDGVATETGESVTAEFDESEIPTAEAASDADNDDAEQSTTADTAPSEPAAAESTADPEDGDTPADDSSEPAPSVDDAAAAIPDDDGLEDLAARVDAGDVTGADVRAAEAGEGRESTPEIDDVDLSMDDLETTDAAPAGNDRDWPDDAGPLAGSVGGDDGSEASDDGDDAPGLLARLKRLFSF